jgi:hypothetical protein
VLKAVDAAAKYGPVPQWMKRLAAFDAAPAGELVPWDAPVDPQAAWLRLHTLILEFLRQVPSEQQLRVRGEDLVADPAGSLPRIALWLGIRDDPEAVEAMMHPEESPYACFGPPGARLGNDANFLQTPTLRPDRAMAHTLTGPQPWRMNAEPFSADVVELAMAFGYS